MGAILATLALTFVGLAVPAQAAQSTAASCSYYAYSPFRDGSDTVYGEGGGTGTCSTIYMNLKRQRTGPDQVLDTASRNGAGNMFTVKACDWAGTWGLYVEVYGSQDTKVLAPVAPGTIQVNCISP